MAASSAAAVATKDTPRIMLVAASLEILGGQGIQAKALIEGLRDRGYVVDLLPVNPRFPVGLGWLRRMRYARTVFNQMLYLPSLVALRKSDVAHVFSASYWSFLLAPVPALLAARLFGKRAVLHYHSGEAEDHLSHWGALVHPWLRLADEIVVPSQYLHEVFARHGYESRVVKNVVDTARFAYRERPCLEPRLLSVRNFEPHYRVEDVIQAYSLVKIRYPQASLTVAGCGSEERKLRAQAASLGVDGIRFLGRVEPASVPALYASADIFLNAAVIDNQPVSVLEAFASGLPVVSTGTGDIAAMLRDGEAGVLVPPRDPAALASAVMGLLSDPQRALALARRARAEVETYTWGRISTEWADVYCKEAA
ncbi:MAG TPA: glycosyltransferase family 4 protein [Gammaproteobacteria bacterium]|jgi:glycosyltransferase involved in cell wall biosynthesis|nr:glycosyltransferase family 4 protein [Gammaproteobacteria bacterium]